MDKNVIQFVRFMDVMIIAPLLFYLSDQNKIDQKNKAILEAIAIGTLTFNLINFLDDLRNE